ncbi:LysR family transcriptional regulator [Rossellomorea aquimaris]|uniref:LysR family transcriptional regulator n=1 Tax=Rossellomorea aquimaris TaxID=189382 RepID=UPI001CD4202C|nr:LysR family transcriptional regulator [Rossellomorea aquimaris]MCA1055879.1 LysR family transcriptional regulator [Rossellomorea aquimaris]
MIDFEWYRSFVNVYQQRSVSAAARTRFMTQPAVSQHIAALEAEVGESLFTRAPRSMIPTDAGKALYTKVVSLIESLEQVSLEVKYESSKEKAKPVLKMGGPMEYVTKRVVPRLSKEHAQYIATFGLTDRLFEQLLAGTLDFMISTKRINEAGVQYVPLETEEFVVTAPASLPLPEYEDFQAWLDAQSWLTFGLELPIIRRYYLTQFATRPDIRPDFVLPNMGAVLAGIEAGHGISVMPAYFIKESLDSGKVQIIEPDRIATNVIYLAYRLESKNDPMIQRILEDLKKED